MSDTKSPILCIFQALAPLNLPKRKYDHLGAVEGPKAGKNSGSGGTKERPGDAKLCSGEHFSLLAEKMALEVSNLQRGEFHFELLSLACRHSA